MRPAGAIYSAKMYLCDFFVTICMLCDDITISLQHLWPEVRRFIPPRYHHWCCSASLAVYHRWYKPLLPGVLRTLSLGQAGAKVPCEPCFVMIVACQQAGFIMKPMMPSTVERSCMKRAYTHCCVPHSNFFVKPGGPTPAVQVHAVALLSRHCRGHPYGRAPRLHKINNDTPPQSAEIMIELE